MKKMSLFVALFGFFGLINDGFSRFVPLQLAIAVNDNSIMIGTDKATTSFPNAGMNTMPTKQVGTDSYVVNPNAPSTKPGYGSGVWPTAPVYNPHYAQPAISNTTH